MQESPYYQQALTAFQQIQIEELIKRDDLDLSLLALENEIKNIQDAAREYFGSPLFRQTIPFDIRTNIDNQLQNTYTSYQQIINERTNNPSNFNANKPNYENQIRSFFNNIYQSLIIPKNLFILSNSNEYVSSMTDAGKEIQDILAKAKDNEEKAMSQIQQATMLAEQQANDLANLEAEGTTRLEAIKNAEQAAQEANKNLAIHKLSQFFYELVVGSYMIKIENKINSPETDDAKQYYFWPTIISKLKKYRKGFVYIVYGQILILVVLLILATFNRLLTIEHVLTGSLIFSIEALMVFAILPLSLFINEARKRYLQGYTGRAKIWLALAIIFSTFSFLFSAYLFRDVVFNGGHLNPETIFVKAVVLIPLLYLSRFALVVYRSNTHLAVINTHRATALQTAQTYITGVVKGPESQDKVAEEIARLVFEPGETGFITRSQGAGPEENNPIKIMTGN